jgi:hypothetical protein
MTGGAFILGQPNLVNLASPCNGRGASIHELESWSIFYNTNLGLLPHIISGFLEVSPNTIMPIESKLLH